MIFATSAWHCETVQALTARCRTHADRGTSECRRSNNRQPWQHSYMPVTRLARRLFVPTLLNTSSRPTPPLYLSPQRPASLLNLLTIPVTLSRTPTSAADRHSYSQHHLQVCFLLCPASINRRVFFMCSRIMVFIYNYAI